MDDIRKIEEGGADYIHVDVMDGHFVPNISFGAPVMKAMNGKTELPYDVHLMIENPDQYIADFVTPQTEFITVHQEAFATSCTGQSRISSHMALRQEFRFVNPATPVSSLECILEDIDLVLVMSVNPGFGGQKFIPSALEKVRQLADLKKRKKAAFPDPNRWWYNFR